jgi:hypothetical protein
VELSSIEVDAQSTSNAAFGVEDLPLLHVVGLEREGNRPRGNRGFGQCRIAVGDEPEAVVGVR